MAKRKKKETKKDDVKELDTQITGPIDERKSKYQKLFDNAKKFFDDNYLGKFKVYKEAFDGVIRRDTLAQWRNAINVPTSFASVRSELVRIKKGLFNDPEGDFWGIDPYDDDPKSRHIADIRSFILAKHAERGHWNVHTHLIAQNSLTYGIGWAKVLWDKEEFVADYWDVSKGAVVKRSKKHSLLDGNVIRWTDPYRVFADPDARTYWDCKYICEMVKLSREELEDNSKGLYNVTEEYKMLLSKLKDAQFKDIDSFTGFYIYKRDRWVLFVGFGNEALGNHMIMDIENPYKHAMIPLVPMIKYLDDSGVPGKGVIEIIYDLAKWQNKIYNLAADNLEIGVHKVFIHEKSDPLDSQTLDIYPAKVLKVNPGENLKTLDMGQPLPAAYFQEMKDLKGLFNEAVGSLDILNAPTGIGEGQRTLGGMSMVLNEANMVFADDITVNKKNFIVPIVMMMNSNIEQYMTPAEMKEAINEDTWDAMGLELKDLEEEIDFKYSAKGDSSMETELGKLTKLLTVMPVISGIITSYLQFPQLEGIIKTSELIEYVITCYKIPRDMLVKQIFNTDQQDTPEVKGNKQKIMAIAAEVSQQTGQPIQVVMQRMLAGIGPNAQLTQAGKQPIPAQIQAQGGENQPPEINPQAGQTQ